MKRKLKVLPVVKQDEKKLRASFPHDRGVARNVLTNEHFFRLIVDFLPGIPYVFLQILHQNKDVKWKNGNDDDDDSCCVKSLPALILLTVKNTQQALRLLKLLHKFLNGSIDYRYDQVYNFDELFDHIDKPFVVEEPIEIFEWLKQEGYIPRLIKPNSLRIVTSKGLFEVVKWLYENGEFTSRDVGIAMVAAISKGYLKIFFWLHEQHPERLKVSYINLTDEAASVGNLDLIKFLEKNRPEPTGAMFTLKQAAENGHLNVVKYLFQKGIREKWYYNGPLTALDRAATNGHTEVVKFLLDQSAPFTNAAVAIAITRGDLKFLRRLYDIYSGGFNEETIETAAANGQLDIVRFFHHKLPENFTEGVMDEAAANGHLNIVYFLHTNRSEGCTTKAMDEAAANGHLEVVRFLHTKRTEGCTTKAMDGAASRGHLVLLKFLHENRAEGCTTSAMPYAACCGQLEVIKFLHENNGMEGYAGDAIIKAAFCGHLEIIKFLHENRKANFVTDGIYGASMKGHLEIVKFLHEKCNQKVPLRLFHDTILQGHLPVVRYLHKCLQRHGMPVCSGKLLASAASRGNFEMVRFLAENCTIDEKRTSEAINEAVHENHFEIVKYLYENDTGAYTEKPLVIASSYGRLEMVDFLFTHRKECQTPQVIQDAYIAAAMEGHMNILRYFSNKIQSKLKLIEVMDVAFFKVIVDENQRVPMVQYLIETMRILDSTLAIKWLMKGYETVRKLKSKEMLKYFCVVHSDLADADDSESDSDSESEIDTEFSDSGDA